MKNWIRENVNPPGIDKKNRGSLFSAIGRVFGIVRNDAQKAFNAHFPYLCDPQKLKEHGKSLRIPCLPFDTEDEYRARVAAASFYLMRAGERSYCIEQLNEHFGDRYILSDEFLRVYVKILDLEDEDRAWVFGFLDEMLNPNIELTVAEWFHFIDEMTQTDSMGMLLDRVDVDIHTSGFYYDGRFLCDQGKETLCDGQLTCDGSWNCDRFIPVRGTVFDTVLISIFPNGVYKCNGSFDCSGYAKVYFPMDVQGPVTPIDTYADKLSGNITIEPFEDRAVITPLCDGSFLCDGSNQASMIDAMKLRIIRPLRCDGTKSPSCSLCDGSIICDGSYTGFDGWYYSGDVVQEEIL